jgi:alkanesulfonate monooxygenase SsuD/methylene tetrahydromethanopterin reductase-like flavin-dependent oxidoreductase (luciferase family)
VDDVLQANLTGDEAAVCERIDRWAEAGVDYVVIQPMPPIEGARFFGERIIHRYR